MESVALGQVFPRVLQFSPSVSFHQRSTAIFLYMMLLPKDNREKPGKPSKKSSAVSEIGEHWIGKYFHFFTSSEY
jgi:hypothetical protein